MPVLASSSGSQTMATVWVVGFFLLSFYSNSIGEIQFMPFIE